MPPVPMSTTAPAGSASRRARRPGPRDGTEEEPREHGRQGDRDGKGSAQHGARLRGGSRAARISRCSGSLQDPVRPHAAPPSAAGSARPAPPDGAVTTPPTAPSRATGGCSPRCVIALRGRARRAALPGVLAARPVAGRRRGLPRGGRLDPQRPARSTPRSPRRRSCCRSPTRRSPRVLAAPAGDDAVRRGGLAVDRPAGARDVPPSSDRRPAACIARAGAWRAARPAPCSPRRCCGCTR